MEICKVLSELENFLGSFGNEIDNEAAEAYKLQAIGVHKMTTREINIQVKEMRKFAAEIKKSPERAREFLHKTGMYTKNGNLKKQFQ